MNRYIAGIILAAAAGMRAQPGAPIQAETRMVLVDVTVTDKKGNPVPGLTQKDFRIWEDNREQVVSSFSAETAASLNAAAPRRYLVLFFDGTTIGMKDRARVRDAAAGLIQANSGAKGLIGLVNFSGGLQIVQNFTGDTERLNESIAGINFGSAAGASGASAFSSGGFRPSSSNERFQNSTAPTLASSANTFGNRDLLLALRSLAANLNAVRGRKGLVLFTAGFPATAALLPEITAVLDSCNRSNVTLYPIDLSGLDAPASSISRKRNPADVGSNSAPIGPGRSRACGFGSRRARD